MTCWGGQFFLQCMEHGTLDVPLSLTVMRKIYVCLSGTWPRLSCNKLAAGHWKEMMNRERGRASIVYTCCWFIIIMSLSTCSCCPPILSFPTQLCQSCPWLYLLLSLILSLNILLILFFLSLIPSFCLSAFPPSSPLTSSLKGVFIHRWNCSIDPSHLKALYWLCQHYKAAGKDGRAGEQRRKQRWKRKQKTGLEEIKCKEGKGGTRLGIGMWLHQCAFTHTVCGCVCVCVDDLG